MTWMRGTQMAATSDDPQHGMAFWVLAPFLLAFLFLTPLFVEPCGHIGMVALVGAELLAALTFLGLFNRNRYWWAWRGVGAVVFLAYVWYLSQMLIESGGRVALTSNGSEASAFNAICGLIGFGIPGLWFAISGQLSIRHHTE